MAGTAAGLQGYRQPEVALLIVNPLKSYDGLAAGHPMKWLQERLARGMRLLVVDPRRSDIARRALVHLQPEPGHDPAILAALIHVVLGEGLGGRAFRRRAHPRRRGAAVGPFTPERVGAAADVRPDTLVEIASAFAAPRGYIACGAGFSRSSTLVDYLALVLETVCGHRMREGEVVHRTTTLILSSPYRAQAKDPWARPRPPPAPVTTTTRPVELELPWPVNSAVTACRYRRA